VKRAARRAETQRVIKRRERQFTAIMGKRPSRTPGHARKKSHLDCGRSGCGVCSVRREYVGPTIQELRAEEPEQ